MILQTDRLSVNREAVDEVLHRGDNQRTAAGMHHI